jgi:hypothetical protein
MNLLPLAPRARWLFHLQALARLAVFGPLFSVGAGVGLSWAVGWQVGLAGGSVVGLVLVISSLWLPTLAYERFGYALTERELLVRRGVLTRRLTAIPTSRIQHVDTQQGPLEQAFGLTRLLVFTASGQGADGVIPGLDPEEADRLRDELVRGSGDDGV